MSLRFSAHHKVGLIFRLLILLIPLSFSACSHCKRAIEYQAYRFQAEGAEIKVPKTFRNLSTTGQKEVKVNIGTINIGKESIREASETIQILDFHQYQNCLLLESVPKKDRKYVAEKMVDVDANFNQLALILSQPQEVENKFTAWLELERVRQTNYKSDSKINEYVEKAKNPELAIAKLNEERLDNTSIITGVGLFFTYLDGEPQPTGLISAEILSPKTARLISRLAPTFEVGTVSWKKDDAYPTLPGQPSVSFEQENHFIFAGAGARKYFSLREDVHPYIGGILGYSWENEDKGARDWYANILGGVALYPFKKFKSALELRYVNYTISEKHVRFNPLGEADVTLENKRESGMSIGIIISRIFW